MIDTVYVLTIPSIYGTLNEILTKHLTQTGKKVGGYGTGIPEADNAPLTLFLI